MCSFKEFKTINGKNDQKEMSQVIYKAFVETMFLIKMLMYIGLEKNMKIKPLSWNTKSKQPLAGLFNVL